MKKALSLALLGLLVIGCSEAKKESLADEKQALQGRPMPPGTWDKIAAQRKAYEASHGGASAGGSSPGMPSGAPPGG